MQPINSKIVTVILVLILLMVLLYCYINQPYRFSIISAPLSELNEITKTNRSPSSEQKAITPNNSLQYQQPSIVFGRTDVVMVTPWLAPVVWEGTFNPNLLDSIYKLKNIRIAATVFAVGKYTIFLKNFLETAEQHFFVGFQVHVYVFTDRPLDVPQVKMSAGRQLTVRSVPNSQRWQEISARRMELIQKLIEDNLHSYADYIFCLDVDSQFHGRWGTESLGGLVGVIHPGYYRDDRSRFPYERRPESRAYVAPGEGDFYYCGGAFGGTLEEVHLLTKTCHTNFIDDAKEGIEAAWQEESHLNRYMWINKPSKVLSPEYLWQDFKPRNPEVHLVRFSGVIKNYAAIRPNV
ncbi:globoside alpha-1,3-N-acetylgalactosaminyltransferase 1-like isoform X2 [Mastacembelus armatus]|uniref:globoside alpha-1,3-N-acetylgalactosaminyltransferase 1-like isoform X2 n=1 Tax=Mastacembelus armatus TaxID=205130 RepID=UPI000E459B36|nr:globoside alpha-1,3-N-acetylgalactosaminyltransferase 1-like isoform X2 [Mastacembelus armatus]